VPSPPWDCSGKPWGAAEFQELERDLTELSQADGSIIEHLTTFVETMNAEVDGIVQLLRAGDVHAAIARKLAFEDQISPTFRRSKELLVEIGKRSHAVRAA
jgi:hypothetical protein